MANYGGFCGTGLFVLKSKTPVPLTAVHYDVDVTSFAARIKIQQTYRNTETDPLECVYGFPVNDQAGIIGFVVTIDDRTLVSHFKEKDEAFQEYTEAISRGDGGYLLDQSDRSDDTFVLSVGRLPPGKECTVSIIYVSTLESVTDTKMRLVIPMSLSPRYNPNPGASAGGVVPPEKYQATVPYLATLLGTINAVGVISSVNSPTHPLAVTLVGPQTVSVTFGANQQPLDRDLVIEIEVKTNPQYHVEVERIGENTYAAMYAFIPKATTDTGNNINTELIFLVDCSVREANAAHPTSLRHPSSSTSPLLRASRGACPNTPDPTASTQNDQLPEQH
ncbi:putative von Willebrand factor A domain-containing protein 5A [Hypsibius exemplaris]|uniref:von Willebrand factor A domain-containing protein 5A n=1 Tax=Hypsibius exemplaris TaxID=2072580 RepID=A0A9X6NF74_HYPEX|nr:putative von Willebrand factor A domain-containing protein 5A [Hypsibius exemplaris]